MNRLETFVEKHLRHVANALEDLGRNLELVVAGFETHDADVFRSSAFHAGNGALHFRERDLERRLHRLGPVHHRRAEAVRADAGLLHFFYCHIEGRVGDVVEIRFRITWHFHAAWFEMFPAEFLGRPNLAVNSIRCLVADACENHNRGPKCVFRRAAKSIRRVRARTQARVAERCDQN